MPATVRPPAKVLVWVSASPSQLSVSAVADDVELAVGNDCVPKIHLGQLRAGGELVLNLQARHVESIRLVLDFQRV